jgi:tetratricopeptide (TPR) repeat protein
MAAYLGGRYDEARNGFEQALGATTDPVARGEILYWRGQSILGTQRDYAQARASYEQALATMLRSELRPYAKLGVADTYFLESNFEAAKTRYDALRKFNNEALTTGMPKTYLRLPMDEIFYRLGYCYEQTGLPHSAAEYYELLLERPSFAVSPRYTKARQGYERVTGGAAYYVQAGAFGREGNARSAERKIRALSVGPAGIHRVITRTGQVLFAVRVGPFKTQGEARDVSDRLRAAGFDTRVIP